jgi:alpha-ribazole phosphatase/probable phosphoglycerate mutase
LIKIIEIVYFVHGTTTDNEQGLATGWEQGTLSNLGITQTKELSSLIKNVHFDEIFTSDLKRAVDSAQIIWGSSRNILQDERLRECNYGAFTRSQTRKLREIMIHHIDTPFLNGESYIEVEKRMRSFLSDLQVSYVGKKVAVVSHQAPQLAFEVIINGKTWEQAIREDWRTMQPKAWKPGWSYILEDSNALNP